MSQLHDQNMFGVSGKIACVTGASSGIGRALATALAEAGASVVGVARRADALADWQDEKRGETAVVCASLSTQGGGVQDISETAAQVRKPFGNPDILINAAGVNLRQTADDVTHEGWAQTLDVNLSVPFFLAQAFAGAMRQKGWGRIVNIASLQTERAFPGGIAYGASKAAIGQVTRAMAEAWSVDGVLANAIAPGFFPTELTGPVFDDPKRASRNAAQTCMNRNGELSDLVGPALFFCSEASRYVTGQVLYVDGGYTAK